MNLIVNGEGDTLVLFAHGAGAGMDSEFMQEFAENLAKRNCRVIRFNFAYMQANKDDGKKRPPERMPRLLSHFETVLKQVIEEHQPKRVFLMGKSMGGRVAAILSEALEIPVLGIICVGYPFIPIKGGNPRLEPLQGASHPVCIIQGERDRFGNRQQVAEWDLPENVEVQWVNDGDHSLQPRKMSGYTWEQNLKQAIDYCEQFIGEIHA
ncbi:alpha/beta fold hydrolase [Parashewanella curva]|uniref:Alpha/beta fold hydrolase n=1 Tax=Parashewanella curva TaxID=2338552 RepID=A0A3L8PX07_9GAMM|nr:alpha/beta fold hydrolase [Parashewanella curva]RLV59904.1 alpha/beta fold hydrolase [Parashewanella curva]